MLIPALILFGLAAILGLTVAVAIFQKKETSKAVALSHTPSPRTCACSPRRRTDLFDHVTAAKSFWLIPGAPHTNFHRYIHSIKAEYEQRVIGFIDRAVKKTGAEEASVGPPPKP